MIGRQDNENLHLIYSDDLYTWEGGQAFLQPKYPWEFVQIGNCGSPIELDEGWLLFTHGVGPVRKYAIGAVLLDKNDPSKVLARSREPLVRPDATEREGYVPNVVYTCGALRQGDRIILPYAVSDTFSNFATMKIAALLQALDGLSHRASTAAIVGQCVSFSVSRSAATRASRSCAAEQPCLRVEMRDHGGCIGRGSDGRLLGRRGFRRCRRRTSR